MASNRAMGFLSVVAAALFPGMLSAADAPSIQVDNAVGTLAITHAGRPLLEYAYSARQYKPYVRKLYAANGLNVLLDGPADHLHHHGLMYAVRVNGVNFWEEVGDPGHEVSVKLLSHDARVTASGLPQARFSQLIHWVAHTNAAAADTAARALLVETRTITVTLDKDEVAVDWMGDFVAGPASPAVRIHGSAYNGLGLRFPESFNHVARRQNSGGAAYTAEAKWDLTPGRWTAVGGLAEDHEAMAALFAFAANKGEPRFFTMLNPFTYASVTQNLEQQPLEYAAGDKFRIRYLVTVYPGSKTKEFLDQRATRWAAEAATLNPPSR